MQAETVKSNEALASNNVVGVVDALNAQCDLLIAQECVTVDSGVSKCDAGIEAVGSVTASVADVVGVAGVLTVELGMAVEAAERVQTGAENEVNSDDHTTGTLIEVSIFERGPTKAGEGGEGGAAGEVAGAGSVQVNLEDGPKKGGETGEVGAVGTMVTKDGATFFGTGMPEAGKRGEGGVLRVSNAEFNRALSTNLPQGATLAVCSKPGDPTQGGWHAQRAGNIDQQCQANRNNYVNTAAFWPETDGSVRARQANFAALMAIVLDDVGTKVAPERVADIDPSWKIETSPGNFQVGFILAQPMTDVQEATRFQTAFIADGLCDPGATGATRWVRLPVAVNGKPKYHNQSGRAWPCKLAVWNPDNRFTAEQLLTQLGVTVSAQKPSDVVASGQSSVVQKAGQSDSDVYSPKAAENPVVAALKDGGLYKRLISAGKHDISCPWVAIHRT